MIGFVSTERLHAKKAGQVVINVSPLLIRSSTELIRFNSDFPRTSKLMLGEPANVGRGAVFVKVSFALQTGIRGEG